jgi:hypothetical protein
VRHAQTLVLQNTNGGSGGLPRSGRCAPVGRSGKQSTPTLEPDGSAVGVFVVPA